MVGPVGTPQVFRILRNLLGATIVALAAISHTLAFAEDGLPENDPEGAVLCIWRLYVAMDVWGKTCPGRDYAKYEPLMTELIGEMDRFITANSSLTQAALDAEKERERIESRKRMKGPGAAMKLEEACRRTHAPAEANSYALFLNAIDKDDGASMRRGIAQLLAHPRKPVMNPCL
jgi:hypothetical protein